MTRRTLAFVFARGGSKGVPRKNLQLVNGTPLLSLAIRAAQAASGIDAVVVSTDDDEVAALAVQEGADVPDLRPSALAEDGVSELLAWKHAIAWFATDSGWSFSDFVSVPPTAPLRSPDDLDACLALRQSLDYDIVVTGTPAPRHPAFNMVERTADGSVRLVVGSTPYHRRQDVPPTFNLTTVGYATTPSHVATMSSLWDGRVGLVEVPPERAIDVDTEFDLRIAQLLARDR